MRQHLDFLMETMRFCQKVEEDKWLEQLLIRLQMKNINIKFLIKTMNYLEEW